MGSLSEMKECFQKIYAGPPNVEVLTCALIGERVLDIGCGAGVNAAFLKERGGHKVWGITLSADEARIAADYCEDVQVINVETNALPYDEHFFDTILMSHVLEHMISPKKVLCKIAKYLKPEGTLIVALPNMAHWRLRLQFLRGNWERQDHGPMDETHLHFWSFMTAASIFEGTPFSITVKVQPNPRLPFWLLRRILPRWCSVLDRFGFVMANMRASQVIMVAHLRNP
jgi:SAM-dependent methyltransferase